MIFFKYFGSEHFNLKFVEMKKIYAYSLINKIDMKLLCYLFLKSFRNNFVNRN